MNSCSDHCMGSADMSGLPLNHVHISVRSVLYVLSRGSRSSSLHILREPHTSSWPAPLRLAPSRRLAHGLAFAPRPCPSWAWRRMSSSATASTSSRVSVAASTWAWRRSTRRRSEWGATSVEVLPTTPRRSRPLSYCSSGQRRAQQLRVTFSARCLHANQRASCRGSVVGHRPAAAPVRMRAWFSRSSAVRFVAIASTAVAATTPPDASSRIRGAHTRAPNAGRRSWSPLEARRSRSGSRGLWPQRLHRRCLLRRRQQSASSVGRLLVTPRVDARKWCARPLVLRGPSWASAARATPRWVGLCIQGSRPRGSACRPATGAAIMPWHCGVATSAHWSRRVSLPAPLRCLSPSWAAGNAYLRVGPTRRVCQWGPQIEVGSLSSWAGLERGISLCFARTTSCGWSLTWRRPSRND